MEIGYLYLVIDDGKFKVGYSKDPRKRQKQYKTHNATAKIIGIYAVEDKSMEKSVFLELLKLGYRRCNRYPLDEWFNGEISLNRLQWIIDCVNARRSYVRYGESM